MNKNHSKRRELLKFLALTPVSGCMLLRDSSPERKFPSAVRPQMHGELNRARDTINHVGVHRIGPKSVEARLVPGQRRLGGVWAWLVSYPGFPNGLWVHGLCYGRRIEVGRNPGAGDPQIHWPTVHHEFVHHWLMTNGHGPQHHPAYDRHVNNWARARQIVGQTLVLDGRAPVTEAGLRAVHGPGPLELVVELDGYPVAIDAWIPESEPQTLSRPTPIPLSRT
jgi:hypothetical protein